MSLELDQVLIRRVGAQTPHGYDDFAAAELGLTGTWADPDGDGNYCIVA